MTNLLTAEGWIVGLIKADSALHGLIADRVYLGVGAQTAAYPFLVVQHMDTRPVLTNGASVILWNELIMVKGVDKEGGGYGTLEPILSRVRAVLHAESGTTLNGTVVSCVEERTVRYPEVSEGVTYRHLGLAFRIQTQ